MNSSESSSESKTKGREVHLFTEQHLDSEFNFLLKIITVFGSRHGFDTGESVRIINEQRRNILKAVGSNPAFRNFKEPWSTEDELDLLSEFRRSYPFSIKLESKFGRSLNAIQSKLNNLKYKAIIKNYDAIMKDLAQHLHDELEIDAEWFLRCADDFWSYQAEDFLKEKVEKFRSEEEEE